MTRNDDALVSVSESAGLSDVGADWVRLCDWFEDGNRPAESLRLASALAGRTERALRLAVRQARAAGLTWDQIGDLLGVTKQAAHLRFSKLM